MMMMMSVVMNPFTDILGHRIVSLSSAPDDLFQGSLRETKNKTPQSLYMNWQLVHWANAKRNIKVLRACSKV